MTGFPKSPPVARPTPQMKRVRPKTYSVAVYLVSGIVVLEIAMIISVFWLRAMVVSVNVGVPKAKLVTNDNRNTGPVAPPHPKIVEVPSLPSLATTGTTNHSLLKVPGVSDVLEQVSNLNEESQILLHQNDLRHAAAVLNEAEDLDPRNPTTLKNLAETYYLMNASARAKSYWQRLADLGPGVGTVYALAKDHVLLLDSAADAKTLAEPSAYPRAVYIDQVEKTPVETTGGAPRFHLSTVLMRKDPDVEFQQKKLQVYVIFYQQMPDGRLLPDLSQRKGSFEDTFLFWNNKLHESFSVDYLMPVLPSGGSSGEYYGFVIGIYYDKILQDVRSEPTDLAKRIPLPDAIE